MCFSNKECSFHSRKALVHSTNTTNDSLILQTFDLQNDTAYIGATVGRVANRIGGAQFTLNGTHYKLVANDGKNTLHGTLFSFDSPFCCSKQKIFFPSDFSPYYEGELICHDIHRWCPRI